MTTAMAWMTKTTETMMTTIRTPDNHHDDDDDGEDDDYEADDTDDLDAQRRQSVWNAEDAAAKHSMR